LVEVAGVAEALEGEARHHVASCSECAELASEERRLHAAFDAAIAPDDPALQQQIMTAVHRRRLRRRLFNLVPMAASLVLAAVGLLMIGGLPGSGLVSLLPLWSGQGWLAFTNAARDWTLVLLTTAQMAGDLIPPLVHVAAALVAVVGFWTSASALSRGRETARWPSRG
jgi:hypothetical protein